MPTLSWYTTRSIIRRPDLGGYEERLTSWYTGPFQAAVTAAEVEADRYTASVPGGYRLGFVDVYHTGLESALLRSGDEIYSLLRDGEGNGSGFRRRYYPLSAAREPATGPSRKHHPTLRWYAVQALLKWEGRGVFEERITIWHAASAESAERQARRESHRYGVTNRHPTLVAIMAVDEIGPARPNHGDLIFTFVRPSTAAPDEYLDTFFDAGPEVGPVGNQDAAQVTGALQHLSL